MARDNVMHVLGACLVLVWMLGVLWLYERFGLPPALALASLVGPGVELYQWVRKEGEPNPEDAVVTMLPILLAAMICHGAGWTRLA